MLVSADARTTGNCDRIFIEPMGDGKQIELDLRSGNIDVIGTAEDEIRVSCRLEDPLTARDVRIEFEPNGRGGRLRIRGGPHHGVSLRIYVPQHSSLNVDCTAGNLTISGVEANQEVHLRAGNLRIEGIRRADYGSVNASVLAGNVNAPRFGAEKSGLFRSFKSAQGGGRYRLKARVLAGNIDIE
jgi:hypothetical protein